MTPRHIGLIASVMAGAWLSTATFADDPAPKNWNGQLVLGKKHADEIKFGNKATDSTVHFPFLGHHPLVVREDRGSRLRIFDGHKEGWVSKDDFILSREGVSYFTDRIKMNDKDTFAWWSRASAWYDRGEFDNAIKDCNQILRLDPKEIAVLNLRGVAWNKKKDYDRAIQDFDAAIRLDPKNPVSFSNRGRALSNKKEYDRAIEDYSKAISLDPKYVLAYDNRGLLWYQKNDLDQAIKDFDQAVSLDPGHISAFRSRGNIWIRKNNFDRAIQNYDEAIRLDSKQALSFHNRGLAWSSKKDYDRAIKDYDEAIQLDPKFAETYIARGIARCHKKDFNRAIEDYREAIRLNPKENLAHYHLAVAQSIRRVPEAIDGFRKILELNQSKGELCVYAVITGHLAARRVGNAEAAKSFLADPDRKLTVAWPHPLVQFLRGDLHERAVMKLATDPDKQTDTRYVLGQVAALEGKTDEALAHFRWVKKHGNPQFSEYLLAVTELGELEREKK